MAWLLLALAGCGGGESAGPDPILLTIPAPTTTTLWANRTDVATGVQVIRPNTAEPVPGVAVAFCATAGTFGPAGGITDAAGVVAVGWSVPLAADTAYLRAGVNGGPCATPIAVVLPR